MKKNILILFLCLAMVLSLFSGCAGKQTPPEETPEPAETAAVAEDPSPEPESEPAPEQAPQETEAQEEAAQPEQLTFDLSAQPVVELPIENDGHEYTIWIGGLNRDAPIDEWDDNYAVKEWIARTGVNMSFDEIAPPTMSEKFNLMIASLEYPDVMSEATSLYAGGGAAMVDEDILIDLAPYLEEYAPSYSWLRSTDKSFAADTVNDNGTITEFYGYAYNILGATSGLMVRGDWLDTLGMDVPTTYDQFHDMLAQIKSAGLCDSPLAVLYSGIAGGAFLEGGFGVPNMGTGVKAWGIMDDQLTFIPTSDEFREYLTVLRDWYSEGLVYPNLLQNAMHKSSDILNGSYGVFFDVGEFISNYERQAPDDAFRLIPMTHPLKSEDPPKIASGDVPRAKQGSAWSVSTQCPEPQVIISAIDYLFSVEGGYLGSYGVEGVTWEYNEEGKPVYTEFATNNPDGWTYTTVTQVYCISIPGILGDQGKYTQTYTQTQIDAASIWLENVTPSENDNRGLWVLTVEENTEFANLTADITTYVSEIIPQMFTGELVLEDTWDEYCATIESMNIARCTELVSTARDRYNARTLG